MSADGPELPPVRSPLPGPETFDVRLSQHNGMVAVWIVGAHLQPLMMVLGQGWEKREALSAALEALTETRGRVEQLLAEADAREAKR